MKQKSKLIIIIASYLLLFTHANADNISFNKIVNNQDLLEDEDSDWEDAFETHSQLLKDQGDKLKYKVKKFRTNFALEWGNSYLKSGKYSKAISEYDKVVKQKPDCAEAYYGKAQALRALHKYNDAIDNYNLAVKYKPDYAEAYYNKSFALLTLGRYQEAIGSCDLAIKHKLNYAVAYNNKCLSLSALGKYQEAIENCDLAIKYDPEYSVAYSNKGGALLALGRPQEGIEACDLSIKYDPEYSPAYSNKGGSLFALGRHKEAIENYDLSIKYDPKDSLTYCNKAAALLELGRYQEAIETCNLAIKYDPEDPDTYLEKGYILSKLNKHKEAEDNFKLVIKYQPNFIEECESIIDKLKNNYFKKHLNERLNLLKKYLAQTPEEGQLENQQEAYNSAIAKIKKAITEGKLSGKTKELCEALLKNHAEREAISKEIAQTQQEMEQLRRNIDYVSRNAAEIDRKLNDVVINVVIDKKIPGVTSKEQAIRWLNTHREEAEKIALEVAKVHNIIPADLHRTPQPVGNSNLPKNSGETYETQK